MAAVSAVVSVGVIGLGVMGEPMAYNLVAAGWEVVVQSRSAGPVERLVAAGARPAANARELAERCQLILVVVGDTSDMAAVLEGPDGLLSGTHDGLVVVDCGSHDPAAMPGFAASMQARGADFLDAPLSGGEASARDGTLAVMVGGSAEALAIALPVLEVVGSTVVHMGAVGTGQIAKACNQLVVAANLQALAEAVALARAAGIIDPARLLTAMAGGLANSRVMELNGPRMLAGDYRPGGKASFHLRDLRNTKAAAKACALDLPVLDLVIDVFQRLIAAGRGDMDHTAILTLLEEEPTMSALPTAVTVSDYDKNQLYHLEGRDWQLLFGPQTGHSDRMTMSIATLPPGSEPPLHVHPLEEEQVYVLDGRGRFLTDDDSFPLSRGVAIRVPVGIRHGAINDGDELLRLLCMFNPPVVPGSYEPAD